MTRPCVLLAVASIGATSGFVMPTATLQKVVFRGVSSKSYADPKFMSKQNDLAVTEADVNDSKPDGFAESVDSLEREIAEAIALDRTTTDASAFVLAEATIPEDLLAKEAISNMETVEAILAVAQQATEAAEASLPDLVSEGIPLIPTSDFNDTMAIPELSTHIHEADESGRVQSFDYPSVKRIITFAASATGVYLCGPLLSLIDTSAVGLLSGTAQQAALNPAVAVTDYAALLIAFLYTGATNLVAAAQERDRGVDGKPRTTASFATALQLSTFVGLGLGTFLFLFARPLLSTLIGSGGISPEVFNAAMKYVRIRALGMPGAAFIGSAQAGCLGMQDVRSPLYVLAGAAIVNFLGDMLFVGMDNPLFGGAAGAAWATVFSQYTAVWFFIRWLCTKPKGQEPKRINLTKNILELIGDENSSGAGRRKQFKDAILLMAKQSPAYLPAKSLASKVASVTRKLRTGPSLGTETKKGAALATRGFFAGKFRGTDLLSLPTKQRAREFAPYFLPVTTTQVGRVSSYIAMSHVVSSTLGTSAMAAQQVILSLFYCMTPIADSLSLTAQSIIPSLAEKAPSRGRADALKNTMENLFKAGGIFGGIMVAAVLLIPFITRFFTADPAVITLVKSVIPMLLGFFCAHGVCMASEGILLGQKDLNYIGAAYGSFMVAIPYFMFRVKRAALAGIPGICLTSVWTIFVFYQAVRTSTFLLRCKIVQRRSDREGAAADKALEIE